MLSQTEPPEIPAQRKRRWRRLSVRGLVVVLAVAMAIALKMKDYRPMAQTHAEGVLSRLLGL
jgi:hypothetical protein